MCPVCCQLCQSCQQYANRRIPVYPANPNPVNRSCPVHPVYFFCRRCQCCHSCQSRHQSMRIVFPVIRVNHSALLILCHVIPINRVSRMCPVIPSNLTFVSPVYILWYRSRQPRQFCISCQNTSVLSLLPILSTPFNNGHPCHLNLVNDVNPVYPVRTMPAV